MQSEGGQIVDLRAFALSRSLRGLRAQADELRGVIAAREAELDATLGDLSERAERRRPLNLVEYLELEHLSELKVELAYLERRVAETQRALTARPPAAR